MAALAGRATEITMRERGRDARLGRPKYLGDGVDYTAYLIDADLPQEGESGRCMDLVARVPSRAMSVEQREQAHREVRLLDHLNQVALPFRVPEVLGHVEFDDRWVMVQTACYGMPLAKVRGGEPAPWVVIGEVAAAIHAVPLDALGEAAPGPVQGRRAHVMACRRKAAHGAPAAFDEALAFVDEHVPAEGPGVLLHGDLHTNNIHIDVLDGDAPGVLDWALATVGDPAYDLARATRGIRRPFGSEEGRTRLLESYNAASEHRVTLLEIRVHELLRRMSDYGAMVKHKVSEAACEEEIKAIKGLLRRARKGTP